MFLAGVVTVIPLFLWLKGVELAGLGTSGMIFFITPTCQFLLGFFFYDEYFDLNKLIGFIIIWIAVAIYLHDLSRSGAGEGNWTLGLNVGNVSLYHWATPAYLKIIIEQGFFKRN